MLSIKRIANTVRTKAPQAILISEVTTEEVKREAYLPEHMGGKEPRECKHISAERMWLTAHQLVENAHKLEGASRQNEQSEQCKIKLKPDWIRTDVSTISQNRSWSDNHLRDLSRLVGECMDACLMKDWCRYCIAGLKIRVRRLQGVKPPDRKQRAHNTRPSSKMKAKTSGASVKPSES